MSAEPAILRELRILDGPNLYADRPAVKLTLDVTALLLLPEAETAGLADVVGLARARPGPAGSAQRRRFVARWARSVTRALAAAGGVRRLAVQARPGPGAGELVVAFPWRRLDKARALAEAVAVVVAAAGSSRLRLERTMAAGAAAVAAAPDGARPAVPRPRIPVVAVTGTNGKTTTTRLIAHLGRAAGLSVGWTSTDGVYVDGVLVEQGDWSGFGGAGRVLASDVQLAVLETARGGILLRGIGSAWNDVGVVTNVTADHLGLQGVATVDQLAEVKACVPRLTRASGWVVLNAEDPRVLAMRRLTKARIAVFALDPDAPGIRDAHAEGGRALTVLDGAIVSWDAGADPEPLARVVDVPVTLGGLSRHNTANALAATAAALALELPRADLVDGLRSFRPDPADNPGRLNVYDVGDRPVVLDLAHNEESLRALLEVARGLGSGEVWLLLGTAGDRTDDLLVALGEIGGRGAEHVVLVEKLRYLRGRDRRELLDLMREGLRRVGVVTGVADFPDEVTALTAVLGRAAPGDVVAVMTHESRAELDQLLRAEGGVAR